MIDVLYFYRYQDKKGNRKGKLLIKRIDLATFFYILIDPQTGKEFKIWKSTVFLQKTFQA